MSIFLIIFEDIIWMCLLKIVCIVVSEKKYEFGNGEKY